MLSLVDVLQFCDLLSLYLCCGAQDDVEFPQTFAGRPARVRIENHTFLTEPRLFGNGLSLEVTARKYSQSNSVEVATLNLRLE
jgi:hypothetical protein